MDSLRDIDLDAQNPYNRIVSDLLRQYKSTHPWLSFRFDISRLRWTDFLRLGEAMSTCEHLAGAPLLPTVSDELHVVTLVRGVLATTAIEGNTMSEAQVRRRIEGHRDLPPSREYQGVAVDNIVAICNEILDHVAHGTAPELTPELIMDFNRQVLAGQDLEPDTEPGQVRRHRVAVGSYLGAPAEDCEHLLQELCDWLNRSWIPDSDATVELRFTATVLKAVLSHLYLAWIHPFGDGNGRTARLLEFLILVRSGVVPSPAAHLLSNHYNVTRDRYYRQLDHSSKASNGEVQFLGYALEGFIDGLREQAAVVREQQMQVTWINHVHERFQHHRMTDTQRRRRELVLAMSPGEPVAKVDIANLNPTIARLYATKSEKTVSRDVNALEAEGLLRKTRAGYLAATDVVEAFLPIRADLDR